MFNVAFLRGITSLMQHGPGGNAGTALVGQPPPLARTNFTHVSGDPSVRTEDRWEVPGDSPMVTSLPFMRWVFGGQPRTASAPRSSVAGTILLVTRRPTSEQDWQDLDDAPFISTEVDHDEASIWAHHVDVVHGFDTVFETFSAWKKNAPSLAKLVEDSGSAAAAAISLKEGSFSTFDVWSAHAGPASLAFLARTTISDLLRADDSLSAEEFLPLALSRATILLGSKDNQIERDDEDSTVCLAAERLTSVLARMLGTGTPSQASLAHKFPSVMADLQLPYMFCQHAITSSNALRELDLSYRYSFGTSNERNAIERDLVLNIGQSLPALVPLLSRFSESTHAYVQLERLTSQLLPNAVANASCLVRYTELDSLLGRAAWTATIVHAINTNPELDGVMLVTLLIQSQFDLTDATAGGGTAAATGSGLGSVDETYGSVREQVLGDALRSEASRIALMRAKGETGVNLVEILMQSDSVILTRAMFLQEAWLHNKSPELGFCSLASPSICSYFAAAFTEDEEGFVPDRLTQYVWPLSELATARTQQWSKLKFLDQQLEINRLLTGTRYIPVSDFDRYTVDSCLRLIREIGSRFCFALNLSITPQDGFSFTDGVDLQIKAVTTARTFPSTECAEWLTYLSEQFATNWLDGGGQHYHSKLRSARPDHEDAQLWEYLPASSLYFANVNARLRRAEPIADMRVAFPSILASDPITLPGTSSTHGGGSGSGGGGGGGAGGGGRGKGKGKGKEKEGDGKGKGKGKKAEGKGNKGEGQKKDRSVGAGCKSSFAYAISPQEHFSCGVVFKVEEIAKHYAMSPPDQYCWPVLLSTKMGGLALELCPQHQKHGGMKDSVHLRPTDFDLDYIYKNFTRKPTTSENEHANWMPFKKSRI